jgi:hypothetical protein
LGGQAVHTHFDAILQLKSGWNVSGIKNLNTRPANHAIFFIIIGIFLQLNQIYQMWTESTPIRTAMQGNSVMPRRIFKEKAIGFVTNRFLRLFDERIAEIKKL